MVTTKRGNAMFEALVKTDKGLEYFVYPVKEAIKVSKWFDEVGYLILRIMSVELNCGRFDRF